MNDVPPEQLQRVLEELTGPFWLWRVQALAYSPDSTPDRLVATHRSFNEYTSVVIEVNTDDTGECTFTVRHPMETDILTVATGLSFEDAIYTWLDRANSEVSRQSPLAPVFTGFDSLTNAIRS